MMGKYKLCNHFVKTNDLFPSVERFMLKLSEFDGKNVNMNLMITSFFFYQKQKILRESYFTLARIISILVFS